MSLTYQKLAIAFLLLVNSAVSIALPFSAYDPRSMAMGGAGVAVADAATAPLFNPALLATTRYSDDFSLVLPSVGARVADSDNLRDSVDQFQSGNYADNLQTSISNLDSATTAATAAATTAAAAADAAATAIALANSTGLPADIAAALAATATAATATSTASTNFSTVSTSSASAATSINNLSAQLSNLSDKAIAADGGIATVVGIPNKKFGSAFYANRSVAIGGVLQYKDAATVSTLSGIATCVSDATAIAATATAALSAALSAATVDPAAVAAASTAVTAAQNAITACGTPSFTSSDLLSGINIRGVMLTEIGISLSREFYINRQRVAVGITPKIVQAQLYEVPIKVNSNNKSFDTGSDYQANYTMANFDLGVAQNYRNGWRSGLVIKNVIPYFLYFKNAPTPGAPVVATGSRLRLMPQTRVGISHTNRWSTVALDADLYRNDPVGLENYTQYISLGGELNAWDWAQIRAGYRVDLVSSRRSVASIGLGLSPFGVHIDMAVAGNENEIGASFQLGFRF